MKFAIVCLLGLASGMKMNAMNKAQTQAPDNSGAYEKDGYTYNATHSLNPDPNFYYFAANHDFCDVNGCQGQWTYTVLNDMCDKWSCWNHTNNAVQFGYYNDHGVYCDHNGCHPDNGNTYWVYNDQCDEYTCWNNTNSMNGTASGSNFGYYNDIGDYCDHNGCQGAYGTYWVYNDHCDEWSCWNNTVSTNNHDPNKLRYQNDIGDWCDRNGCHGNTYTVLNDHCDEYTCWNSTSGGSSYGSHSSSSGGYQDPYCAPNGYCNNTMTYYAPNGDYCDIAYCYNSAGSYSYYKDACDQYGCYNYSSSTQNETQYDDHKENQQHMPSWDELAMYIDADASDSISWAEIEQFCFKMEEHSNYKMSQQEWDAAHQFFTTCDADNNGECEKKEYEKLLKGSQGLAQLVKYI